MALPLYITYPRFLCPGLLDRRKANYSNFTHAGMFLSQVHVLSTEKKKKNPSIRTCQVLIWVKRKERNLSQVATT